MRRSSRSTSTTATSTQATPSPGARSATTIRCPPAPGIAGISHLLRAALGPAIDETEPELAIYNAGTDVLAGDPLGALALSPDAVLERDLHVSAELTRRGVPWLAVTSGGYTAQSHRCIAAFARHVLAGT